MADLLHTGVAAVRIADVVLRANGGRSVLLRMPAPAVSGDDAEQLGLATPEFQDMELAPVVFRKAESTTKLLVAGSVVRAMLGTLAYDSADVLFETAAGIVVDDKLFAIEASVASQTNGEPYGYCLTLRAPIW